MIVHRLRRCSACNHCLADIWLFKHNIDISTVVLEQDETSDVLWASPSTINTMIKNGTFTTWGAFDNMEELFGL